MLKFSVLVKVMFASLGGSFSSQAGLSLVRSSLFSLITLATATSAPVWAQESDNIRLNIGDGYVFSADGCTVALPSDENIEAFNGRVQTFCFTDYAYPVPGTDVIGRSYLLPPLTLSPRQVRPILPPPTRSKDELRAALLVDGSEDAVDALIEQYCGADDNCASDVRVARTDRTYVLPDYLTMTTDPQAVGQVAATTEVVSSQQEVNETFGLDASASVSAAGSYGGFEGSFEGSAMYSVARSFDFSSDQKTALRSASIPLFSVEFRTDLINPNSPVAFNVLEFLDDDREQDLADLLGADIGTDIGDFCASLPSPGSATSRSLLPLKNFFEVLGSHVVTRVVMGGESIITLTSSRTETGSGEATEQALAVGVDVAYENLVSSGSLSTSAEVSSEVSGSQSEVVSASNLYITGRGGYSELLVGLQSTTGSPYAEWVNSVAASPSPIRYGYTPIWNYFPNDPNDPNNSCRSKLRNGYAWLTENVVPGTGAFLEFVPANEVSSSGWVRQNFAPGTYTVNASNAADNRPAENAFDGDPNNLYRAYRGFPGDPARDEVKEWSIRFDGPVNPAMIRVSLESSRFGQNGRYIYRFRNNGRDVLVVRVPDADRRSRQAGDNAHVEIYPPSELIWDEFVVEKVEGSEVFLALREVGFYNPSRN